MGRSTHAGLESFLNKFHQPGNPTFTIITDPDYYVFLWFHNAVGKIIQCPYVTQNTGASSYVTRLEQSSVDFGMFNQALSNPTGISGNPNEQLPETCVDLTPFVREANLPPIAPAGGDKIQTLFGETAAGSFSPYASDGQKSITLQMLDTEYSILD